LPKRNNPLQGTDKGEHAKGLKRGKGTLGGERDRNLMRKIGDNFLLQRKEEDGTETRGEDEGSPVGHQRGLGGGSLAVNMREGLADGNEMWC